MSADGAGSAMDRLRFEDPPELALDLGHRQAPDVEALEARQDRRREVLADASTRT